MKRRSGLTVCMIVRDERENLQEMLATVVRHSDDVVVVDTGSTDDTADLARAAGARVFERAWDDDFAAARNRGLEEVQTSHVLWLDADDRIEGEDLGRVREAALARGNCGLQLLLVNASEDPAAVTSCWQLRVFPAADQHRFEGRIHEQVQECLRRHAVPIERLDVTVTHTGYVRHEDVIRKSRRNFELLRREMNEGKQDDINVLYHYVKAAAQSGELDEAARVARRCVDDPPAGTPLEIIQSCAIQLSRLELQRGDSESAMAVLAGAIERRPDDPVARFFLGDLLRRQGDLEGARREFETARVSPIRFELLPVPVAGLTRAIRVQLGEVLEVLGHGADAAAVYHEARALFPDDTQLGRALARSLVAAGATNEASQVLDSLPDEAMHEEEVTLLRATVAFNEGRDDEAEKLFAFVEQESPRLWAAALHRGHLRLRQADIQGSMPHYERAVAIADNPETRVGLAAAQLEAGLLPKCLDNLAEAVDQCRTRPLPPGTEALSGEALLRFGRPAEAQGAFERHLRRYGPEPRILSRLADCYREMGAQQAARMGYQEALKLDPALQEARNGLSALETAH